MPRFARVIVPECPHHITQRGNAQRDVFFTPADRQVYLGLLGRFAALYATHILGYCLMSNHVHLVAVPAINQSLANLMREVDVRYAQYRNAIDGSSGHLWQNRYYSCAFEPSRLGSVLRYVELNPVRAQMVRHADQYAWSSAIAHLGGADSAHVLDLDTWDWTPSD